MLSSYQPSEDQVSALQNKMELQNQGIKIIRFDKFCFFPFVWVLAKVIES